MAGPFDEQGNLLVARQSAIANDRRQSDHSRFLSPYNGTELVENGLVDGRETVRVLGADGSNNGAVNIDNRFELRRFIRYTVQSQGFKGVVQEPPFLSYHLGPTVNAKSCRRISCFPFPVAKQLGEYTAAQAADENAELLDCAAIISGQSPILGMFEKCWDGLESSLADLRQGASFARLVILI